MIAQILRWKPQAAGGTEEPVLELKLCGENVEIRYAEQHMQRLQVLISGMPRESQIANEPERQTVEMENQAAPREIQVEEPATLAQISTLLGVKPFQAIKALMGFGVFLGSNAVLARKDIEKLVGAFGFAARFIRPAVDI